MTQALARILPLAGALAASLAAQSPAWDELDARQPPAWFGDAKFGIFIHWGVYSVPSFCDTSTYSEWYLHWLKTGAHDGLERRFHAENYGADFAYHEFAAMFRAELWDPAAWAEIFRRAGARYVVLTSKHHDGYCLWPSEVASEVRGRPWHSAAVGPERDIVGELTEAVRAAGLRMGLYYSFMEWDNPLYEQDRAAYVEQVMFPQIRDLITRYQPVVFWPDGEWDHPDEDWRSTEILRWIRAHHPNAEELVVNDRWGRGLRGRVGDFYTTEYGHHGGNATFSGEKPFEECRGIGGSFAFNRAEDYGHYASRAGCIELLVQTVARGGNLLLDVGPTADGRIPLIQVDRLLAMGRWLDGNGAAIHGAEPSPFEQTPWGYATAKGARLFLHVMTADWPDDEQLVVTRLMSDVRRVRVLGRARGAVAVAADGEWPVLDVSAVRPDPECTVFELSLDGVPRVDDRFVAEPDGRIVLEAGAAALQADSLRVETHPGADGTPRDNLGYWTDPDDSATWQPLVVERGRTYELLLEIAVAPGAAGGILGIAVGDDEIDVALDEPTADWRSYREVVAGRVTPGARELAVTLRARSIPHGALCNVRRVTLRPVGDR